MDFFEEMSAALARDGARRGVRCAPGEWEKFNRAVDAVRTIQADSVPATRRDEPLPAAADAQFDIASQESAPMQKTPAALPDDLEALGRVASGCCNCALCKTRQNVVFGEGDPRARLMFIGEGPGADEDATGRPFVGAAGQLLDKMISAMHLERKDVYIANIVKCRPPGNRMPGEEEAAACIAYLERQIELIKPEVIVLLGGTALHFLLKMDGITRCRGRWFEYKNIAVMPTFHPAFLLRKAESKREAWHDLKLVMARLGIAV